MLWRMNDCWTFLTSHARALLCLARDPRARHRDVADCLEITERQAQRVIGDLCAAGYVTRRREGRRCVYEIDPALPLRHPSEADKPIGTLLAALLEPVETGQNLQIATARSKQRSASG